MIYKRELDLRYEVDVFVAGGGAAGVAAAVAAARCGKKVFLAEARGSFGGAAAAGLVPSLGPYYDGEKFVATGIGFEIRKKVAENVPLTNTWTPFRVEEFKRVLDDFVSESGVQYSFFTSVCDVIAENGEIKYVVLNAKSGMFAVKASVYIDCTGDADMIALAGGEYELGDGEGRVMPPTLCSLWANVDFSKRVVEDEERIEQAIKDGVFTYHDRHLPGMIKVDVENGIGGGNIGHTFNTNPTDEKSLTDAMAWGRKSMLEYEVYFKKYLDGYEDMTLVYTADMLGVRESRRVKCDYMMTLDDFKRRADFDDEIGRYFYAVDMHVMTTDEEEYKRFQREYLTDLRYKDGESYGITYRSLIPVSFKNVLVAGRCIGTDRHMQASIRVIPGCFMTGQAAGVAASLAGESGDVRSISISELQNKLIELGAYIPNKTKLN